MAPGIQEIIEVIRDAIPGRPRLDEDTDLLGSGLLDSVSILATIDTLEARYGIEFDPDQLVPETFLDAGTVWRALLTRLPG